MSAQYSKEPSSRCLELAHSQSAGLLAMASVEELRDTLTRGEIDVSWFGRGGAASLGELAAEVRRELGR